MPGLSSSRWAPKLGTGTYYSSISDRPARPGPGSRTTTPPAAPGALGAATSRGASRSRSALDELARYTKIVRRLKWKLPYLASGYRQAVDRVGRDPGEAAEAELMFKLDFFEYYMLVERALVHLLGVFGIAVSRGSAAPDLGNGRGGAADGLAGPGFSHRYHANVLETLDSPGNPLHPVLGSGDARRQLGRAKDLRNRWKNADDAAGPAAAGRAGKASAPLESYDLERILTAIFDGFDGAFALAERFVQAACDAGSAAADMDMSDAACVVSEEEQWEFMVEAMDWEAV